MLYNRYSLNTYQIDEWIKVSPKTIFYLMKKSFFKIGHEMGSKSLQEIVGDKEKVKHKKSV